MSDVRWVGLRNTFGVYLLSDEADLMTALEKVRETYFLNFEVILSYIHALCG